MKTKFLICVSVLLIAFVSFASSTRAQIAVRGEIIYTMTGAPLRDGVVLIRNGKIERVGASSQIQIPSDYKILTAKIVTPGLIDAHSTVGLSGILNQQQDQDQVERSNSVQPELRAVDAYNSRDALIEWLRSFGITTVHTGHSPQALVSGQTMIVKTKDGTVDSVTINPFAMIAVTLGEGALVQQGGRPPGTRAKEIAMLRAELVRAKDYAEKMNSKTPPARDLKLEALARVIKGETPLLVTAHRAQDIASALRLAKEFNLKIVLDGAAESYLLMNEIKAANIPIIIHPTMTRNVGEAENLSMETAANLRKAGIPVALQSGYEGYVPKTRVVLFEAAVAAANGLAPEDALATITIDAARILGIANRVGSLEAGKDADVAMFDGDPFEYTSHTTGVIIDGQIVSQTIR
jgi:imidazolonepropionase-like amidohydrolase